MIQFPDKFLWGAATSAHQVEGDNNNNDWWKWEQHGGGLEPSGAACMHYQLYRQDFDLVQSLGHNCHRLSIEWSRIQPRPGEFSTEALAHYKDVIRALRQRHIEPVVTLHHFTNPQWFADQGGWAGPNAVDLFCAYVDKVVNELSEDVTYWVTINEPLIYLFFSFIAGDWPPNQRSLLLAGRVRKNLIRGHIRAYRLIHAIYAKQKKNRPLVSIAHHMPIYLACTDRIRDRFSVWARNRLVNRNMLDIFIKARALDYIGVNYYSRTLVHTDGWSAQEIMFKSCAHHDDVLVKNSMGWEVYPEGIYKSLMILRRYKMPIFILENGICTDDDRLRWEYIKQHIAQVHKAIQQGVEVIGYTYWSLMDNYEWDKGFVPRFGLIGIDYKTGARIVRPSARNYATVCTTNRLE
jgi:beta-glucosidase